MSENTQAQERTEQPTPKRRQKAREQGQVPRSRELNTMMVTMIGAVSFLIFGDWMVGQLREILVVGLGSASKRSVDPVYVLKALADTAVSAVWLLSPLLFGALGAAVAGPTFLGGVIFSGKAVRPKGERLSPLKGIKRIFSTQGLMELVKTLLKFSVLSTGGAMLLWWLASDILALGRGSPLQRIIDTADIVQMAFFVLASGLVLIAMIDVPFQLWSHSKQLRMTRQEIKDELKETEGNPEMRGRVRRLQEEVAQRRMMHDVPDADVVITNPTRFAVALRYTDRPEGAPRVVAKGRDLVAARIRELAEEHDVPLCSAPPLARALYFTARIGEDIPVALYLSVARVLVWVMQLQAARQTGAVPPELPRDLPVPDELAHNERFES